MIYGLQRYLSIEHDFINAEYYVDPQIRNVYSEFYTREVILLGAEIEAALKQLCRYIDNSEPKDMKDYNRIIIKEYPGIVNIATQNIQTNLVECPFMNWDKERLSWWHVYTTVKHNAVDKSATAGVSLTMLQAYEILVFCNAAVQGDFVIDYLDSPKRYHIPQFISGGMLIQDSTFVRYYSRERIINQLKDNR